MKQHELNFTILGKKFRTKIEAMDIYQAQQIMIDNFVANIDKYIKFTGIVEDTTEVNMESNPFINQASKDFFDNFESIINNKM